MIHLLKRLRHLLLFIILVGSDIIIGVFGQQMGLAGEDAIFPVILFALVVVFVVEFLWR